MSDFSSVTDPSAQLAHEQIIDIIMLNWEQLREDEPTTGYVREIVDLCLAMINLSSVTLSEQDSCSAQISTLQLESSDGSSLLTDCVLGDIETTCKTILYRFRPDSLQVLFLLFY